MRENIEDEMVRQQFSRITPLSPMATSTPNTTVNLNDTVYPDLYRMAMSNASAPLGPQLYIPRNTTI